MEGPLRGPFRSVEGTVNEFAHGYGMRRCRYRGQGTARIQHVLTAIAVNIERLRTPSVRRRPARQASPGRLTGKGGHRITARRR
jgi:hypothetical protein